MKPVRRTSRALASALAADAPVTAFIAPAGYGKSTAARAFAAHYGDAATVDCSRMPDARALRDAIAVADGADAPTLLVENAEALLPSSGAVEVLAERMYGGGVSARVVVCSRVHLPLGRRVGPGSMHVVGPEELVLDEFEARHILSDNGATDEQALRAVRLAQGWPMAVAMLARCARTGRLHAVLDAVAGTELRELISYLTEDALTALDGDALDVLRTAALIPGARIGDLQHAFGSNAAIEAILRGLVASPFMHRDGQNVEVHPLVRMALTNTPNERALHAVAAAARSQEKTAPARAAELFLCSGSADDAARVLQALGPEALRVGNAYTRLLERIDPNVLVRYPSLWMAAEQSRNQSMSPAQHVAEARTVLRNIGRCPVPVLRALVAGIVTSVFDETMNGSLVEEVLAAARRDAQDDAQALLVTEFFSVLHDAFHDRASPPDELRPRFASLLLIPEMRFSFEAMIAAKHARIAGNADDERASLERGLEAACASQMPALVPLSHLELAYFYWRAGESDRCAHHLDLCERTLSDAQVPAYGALIACARGVGSAGTRAQPRLRMYAAIMGASSCGNVEKCLNLLGEARDIARGLGQGVELALVELALTFADPGAEADAIDAGDASTLGVASMANHFLIGGEAGHAPLAVHVLTQQTALRGADAYISGRKFELLAMLALAKRPPTGSEIAESIWADLSVAAARNSLGVTISALRRALGHDAIVFDKGTYRLEMRADVDVNHAEAVAKRVRAKKSQLLSSAEYFDAIRAAAALESLDGNVPAWEWFQLTVARLQTVRRDLLLALARSDFLRGEYETALLRLHALVAIDPCDEEARILLIKLHLARDDHARAYAEYREYARTLHDELQIEPTPDVLALLQSA